MVSAVNVAADGFGHGRAVLRYCRLVRVECRLGPSGSTYCGGGSNPGMGQGELVLPRMRRRHGRGDAPDRPSDLGAIFSSARRGVPQVAVANWV